MNNSIQKITSEDNLNNQIEFSEEQKKRMEKNRLHALEIKKNNAILKETLIKNKSKSYITKINAEKMINSSKQHSLDMIEFSEEQKMRMEKNRLRALEIKKKNQYQKKILLNHTYLK